jgi:nucleoside-triphosphatase
MKIFLTGKPGVGKTTVLLRIIKKLHEKGVTIGGIITPEIREHGKRTGFSIRSFCYGKCDDFISKEITFASIYGFGKRFGKYRINIEKFDSVAIPALEYAMKYCNIIAIDEIGKMEMFSNKFREKLKEILESDKHLIATLHRKLVRDFQKYGLIIEITEDNREYIHEKIIEYF